MDTPKTSDFSSNLSEYIATGTTVLSVLAQARRILPLFRGNKASVAFGAGAVLGATGALVGVAMAVPEARKALLDRASDAADRVRHLVTNGKAPPIAKVKQPPRPRPQPYRGTVPSLPSAV